MYPVIAILFMEEGKAVDAEEYSLEEDGKEYLAKLAELEIGDHFYYPTTGERFRVLALNVDAHFNHLLIEVDNAPVCPQTQPSANRQAMY